MCQTFRTHYRCTHIKNEVEYCVHVWDKIKLGFAPGTFTPCTVIPPDDQLPPQASWMWCGDCHNNFMMMRRQEWDSMWAAFELQVQGSVKLKGWVAHLKQTYDGSLNEYYDFWIANTKEGHTDTIYVMYPRHIEKTQTAVSPLINQWVTDEVNAGQMPGTKTDRRGGGGGGGSGSGSGSGSHHGKSSRSHAKSSGSSHGHGGSSSSHHKSSSSRHKK